MSRFDRFGVNSFGLPLIIIITMLYLTGQQNNRLSFPTLEKKVDFLVYSDPASDSSFENSNDQSEGKREPSITSTIDSRFKSHKDSFSQESEYSKQVEEQEPCEEFYSRGFCFKGRQCCFSHRVKSMVEIKRERKNVFYTQMMQNFPQMTGTCLVQRIPSFLQ